MSPDALPPITLTPIGVIHSPFHEQAGTPIQPATAGDAPGQVELFADYEAGLQDVAGFERIWLVYLLDRARPWQPLVVPYRDTVERGIFATRSPTRPCPIGMSAVELVSVAGCILEVRGIDVLDGTPLLDLKPYVPEFDAYPHSKDGWFADSKLNTACADERFEAPKR